MNQLRSARVGLARATENGRVPPGLEVNQVPDTCDKPPADLVLYCTGAARLNEQDGVLVFGRGEAARGFAQWWGHRWRKQPEEVSGLENPRAEQMVWALPLPSYFHEVVYPLGPIAAAVASPGGGGSVE